MNNLIKNLQLNQAKTIQPQDLDKLKEKDSFYKFVSVIGSRANQINASINSELKQKLREFESFSEAIDEIKENKEQAEMSRLYEMLPHSTLLALNELKNDKLVYRRRDELEEEELEYEYITEE